MIFFTQKIVSIIYFLFYKIIKDGPFFNPNTTNKKIQAFFIDFGGDFLSLIGFLLYLELIVLHFCRMDYNVKVNIIKRGYGDYQGINIDVNDTIIDGNLINEENEENEENGIINYNESKNKEEEEEEKNAEKKNN